MRIRSAALAASVVLLAGMTAGGIASAQMPGQMPGAMPRMEMPRTISVSGTGTVDSTPDIARLSLAVQRRDVSMQVARDETVRVSKAFLALCKKLGIPENKIRTSGLTINPEYRWDEKDEPAGLHRLLRPAPAAGGDQRPGQARQRDRRRDRRGGERGVAAGA